MLLVAALRSLRILSPTGRGVHVMDGTYISNEAAQVERLVSRPMRVAIGGNEFLSMLDGGTIAYWKDLPNEPEPAAAVAYVTTWLHCLRALFMALWLVRDNAVNCETGYLEHDVPGQGLSHTSNFIAALFSTARGTTDPVAFTVDEIRRAREYFKTFFFPVMFNASPGRDMNEEIERLTALAQPALISAKGVTRLTRLLYFLSAARSAHDLGVKISLYMTCFEIMFSVESTELTHRLSERVAVFLYTEPGDRLSAYRRMKRGYNIRSKVIHGSVLTNTLERELAEASVEIDELLRRLVERLASDPDARLTFELDDVKLEDYFLKLTLGVHKEHA
jgi:hypothetical protein